MWPFNKSKDIPPVNADIKIYPLTQKPIDTATENEIVDIWIGYDHGFRYANAIKIGNKWCDKEGYPLHFRLIRFWIETPPDPV